MTILSTFEVVEGLKEMLRIYPDSKVIQAAIQKLEAASLLQISLKRFQSELH